MSLWVRERSLWLPERRARFYPAYAGAVAASGGAGGSTPPSAPAFLNSNAVASGDQASGSAAVHDLTVTVAAGTGRKLVFCMSVERTSATLVWRPGDTDEALTNAVSSEWSGHICRIAYLDLADGLAADDYTLRCTLDTGAQLGWAWHVLSGAATGAALDSDQHQENGMDVETLTLQATDPAAWFAVAHTDGFGGSWAADQYVWTAPSSPVEDYDTRFGQAPFFTSGSAHWLDVAGAANRDVTVDVRTAIAFGDGSFVAAAFGGV